ncbi:histidinol dehydrogenase [Sporosarcina sp. P21c]|uniref:histidinol dehydrogenase n=1 Tax=unclassified Sporosarcina TaxID=2647733 RepID=UPI000C17052A|nr:MULTISPECIES: histidinol dehydrogenase [unclassified Sporosarcina]PIC67072.1 histidinol dehydrogenase [Sporosarcina sp. P16a]PIC83413.1 histidinol dehydrogenase [Sporosarcina sp. P1]PIC89797.1 histidinol dehydrogenase [Sporosarcina sp. P21c]PIC92526.1 histidinol dehydrogenase [Sporosarcina sp. P25]
MKIIRGAEFTEELLRREDSNQTDLEFDRNVLSIIDQVRSEGDKAVLDFTERFDGVKLDSLIVTEEEINEAQRAVTNDFFRALRSAKERITTYHEAQKEQSWFLNPNDGIMLGQKVTPIDSVGIYVPGGKAAYPSTVLMNTLPAKIAGVGRISMVTPPQRDGKINPHVLVAAKEAGVDRIYKIGGAQAIAALAYGTKTIEKVVKITGPGNAYVARAKKWVFGDVAIDMIAGPSEICVVADANTNPVYAAADLLSQAEHDERAAAVCITTSEVFATKLSKEVERQLAELDRKEIATQSIENFGRIIVVDSLQEAFDIVNRLAPEHLELMIDNSMEHLAAIRNAGAIFLGQHSPEALGDYMAGPNHTLPTSGTAAFSSPLGVYDFMKKSSIIYYSENALAEVADDIITLADAEQLTGHAKSIKVRKAGY